MYKTARYARRQHGMQDMNVHGMQGYGSVCTRHHGMQGMHVDGMQGCVCEFMLPVAVIVFFHFSFLLSDELTAHAHDTPTHAYSQTNTPPMPTGGPSGTCLDNRLMCCARKLTAALSQPKSLASTTFCMWIVKLASDKPSCWALPGCHFKAQCSRDTHSICE